MEGSKIYVTLFPCNECAKAIIQSGIREVIYWQDKYKDTAMDCFWAEVTAGHLELKEAEAAKWLTKDQLGSVGWLPADVTLIEKIRRDMEN